MEYIYTSICICIHTHARACTRMFISSTNLQIRKNLVIFLSSNTNIANSNKTIISVSNIVLINLFPQQVNIECNDSQLMYCVHVMMPVLTSICHHIHLPSHVPAPTYLILQETAQLFMSWPIMLYDEMTFFVTHRVTYMTNTLKNRMEDFMQHLQFLNNKQDMDKVSIDLR